MKLGIVTRPARALLAALSVVIALAIAPASVVDCTPAARQDAIQETKAIAPAAIDGGCVLLELVDDAQAVHQTCVLAEDLAKLLSTIPTPDRRAEGASVAFAVPPMKIARTPPKRHCAQWTYVDAGAGANPRDAPKDASSP